MKKSSLIAIILIVLLAFIGVFFFLKHRAATNKDVNSTTETTQEKNSKIINLTEKNFESTIKKTKEPLLVCFSASWCSYCQKEKPILKKLANEKNSKFKIAIIDTDENQALAQKQGITGLPTHVVFYGGKEKERISSAGALAVSSAKTALAVMSRERAAHRVIARENRVECGLRMKFTKFEAL